MYVLVRNEQSHPMTLTEQIIEIKKESQDASPAKNSGGDSVRDKK